jgi:hypothetical protein
MPSIERLSPLVWLSTQDTFLFAVIASTKTLPDPRVASVEYLADFSSSDLQGTPPTFAIDRANSARLPNTNNKKATLCFRVDQRPTAILAAPDDTPTVSPGGSGTITITIPPIGTTPQTHVETIILINPSEDPTTPVFSHFQHKHEHPYE